MAYFLLIHGSCHGAWCWRDLIPELERLGHIARAIDLPAHGDDPTPVADVTLDLYARRIKAALEEAPGPVVLVGHSMGGYPATAAAELAPERIARLVYLCAYVPTPGLSLAEMRRAGPRQLLRDAIRVAPNGDSFTIDPALAEAVFYHDCPPGTLDDALPRLCPQPILPQETPMAALNHAPGLVRHYIRCLDDRTIPPEYQETMVADWPAERVHALDCGHSPFFARPVELAAILDRIARP